METINKKILIVEDDKEYLWIMRQSLEDENLTIVYAGDGEEGLKMAEKEKPDLILLDIIMPKMDGIEMAKKLKEKGIKSKVMFLTNVKDEKKISDAIEVVKETEYIVKADLHIDQIVKRVKSKLGLN